MNYRKITNKHAEARVYGNIGGWIANGENFTTFLEDIESKGFDELTIRLHCYGGSVFEGNVIQNAMSRSKLKINVIIDGIAASMGFMFLTGTNPKDVQVVDNGFGMIHRPSSMTAGDVEEHLATTKLLRDIESNFIKVISQRSKLSADEVKSKWFDGKDHWLNADEMVKYGFAGKVIPAVTKDLGTLKIEDLSSMNIDNVYDKFAAFLPVNSHDSNKNKFQMKQLIIATFALAGLTAESSDSAILEALKAEMKKKDDRITELENAAKAEIVKAIDAIIAEVDSKISVPEGKTKDEVKADLKKIGETSGLEVLKTVVSSMGSKPATPIVEMLHTGADGKQTKKTWAWYQENDPQALVDLEKSNYDQFKELYKAEYGTYPTKD